MAALSDPQLAYLATQLGTSFDQGDAQDRFDRLMDTRLVVKEVLEQRLADLLAAPAQFSVSGEYSQNTSENIKAVQAQLERVIAGSAEGAGYSTVRVSRPSLPYFR